MAAKLTSIPILVFLILFTITNPIADAEDIDNNDNGSLHLMNETLDLEWQFQTQFHLQPENVEDEDEDEMHRRSLYWKSPAPTRYYISYGALSANRVPCPPRSGRSYYTPNCFRARGPVHPYTRGCSAITRCRR